MKCSITHAARRTERRVLCCAHKLWQQCACAHQRADTSGLHRKTRHGHREGSVRTRVHDSNFQSHTPARRSTPNAGMRTLKVLLGADACADSCGSRHAQAHTPTHTREAPDASQSIVRDLNDGISADLSTESASRGCGCGGCGCCCSYCAAPQIPEAFICLTVSI